MTSIMEKSKSVVITGHSIGGTTASLTTLWLLSYLQTLSSPTPPLLCITFGSPLLGNPSLSQAVLRERWAGNFCHVVSKHDLMPRLLFAPLSPLSPQLHLLLQFWHFSMTSPHLPQVPIPLTDQHKADVFRFALAYTDLLAKAGDQGSASSSFWPFGSYLFCSGHGAICVENAASVVKMMHLMLITGSPSRSIEDHLLYGNYASEVSFQFLNKRNFMQQDFPGSSYEAGVTLALQSSGISSEEPVAGPVKDCLKMARRMGRTPNLNSANLAVQLSKITPYRSEIEWYKAKCDESDDQLGYYDSFKQRGAMKMGFKINMNRIKLANFWDNLINMLANNQLPYDFHKRAKWVNASQFYKLLVEPLDIADYYRMGKHQSQGHYMRHGRERRYEVFDRWWRERRVNEEDNKNRSRFAGLTQDSCFWAKVEEAKELLDSVRTERDPRKLAFLWENIDKFDKYAKELIERKDVSKDVLAKNSSYSSWAEDLKVLKSQVLQFSPQFPSVVNGEVVP